MPLVETKVREIRETFEVAQDPASIEHPSDSQSSHADSQDMHVCLLLLLPSFLTLRSQFCLLCPAQEAPSQLRQKTMQSLQGKVVEILDDPSGLPWIKILLCRLQIENGEYMCDHDFKQC